MKRQESKHLLTRIWRGLLVLLGGLAIAVGVALGVTELRWAMLGSPLIPTLIAALVCFVAAVAGLFLVVAAWGGHERPNAL
jgi:hypothetical protein